MSASNVPATVKIDFVSDVVCPWCAIGLRSLEQALQRLDGKVDANLHFQPFELNPQMPPEGEDIAEHIRKKYGSNAGANRAQSGKHSRARCRAGIRIPAWTNAVARTTRSMRIDYCIGPIWKEKAAR